MYVGVSGGRFEGDPQSLGFEFGDEATSFFVGIHAGGEVVGAEILVRPAGGQHVPNDDDQLVGDGDDRLLVGSGTAEATELADLAAVVLAQVAIGAHGGPRALDQDRLQVLVACAAGTVMAFAGRFVVARAQPHPRGQMLSRGNQAAGSAPISEMTVAEAPTPIPGSMQSARVGHKGMHQLLDLLVEAPIIASS